jgi:7-cyano-7-deazaguanine synthase
MMIINKNGELVKKERSTPNNRHRGLVVCSGGLDSTTVAKIAAQECKEIKLIHFKYGCKAEGAEVAAIENIAKALNCSYEFIDMYWLKRLGGSSLTDEGGVIVKGQAGAEFAHEWVPARNTAMIGIAASYADRFDCGAIYLGLNLEESGAYPDNTREFFEEYNRVLDVGTQARPEIRNPLWHLTKKEIVRLAYEIGAPIHYAWSCYEGGEIQCGQCGPCIMRRTAHEMLNIPETVKYKV